MGMSMWRSFEALTWYRGTSKATPLRYISRILSFQSTHLVWWRRSSRCSWWTLRSRRCSTSCRARSCPWCSPRASGASSRTCGTATGRPSWWVSEWLAFRVSCHTHPIKKVVPVAKSNLLKHMSENFYRITSSTLLYHLTWLQYIHCVSERQLHLYSKF